MINFSNGAMSHRLLVVLLFVCCSSMTMGQSQTVINQTDKNGKKQGHWIKTYPNGNVMYDGFFKNDQPDGDFKRYYEDKTLKSLLVFSRNGIEANATLYYPNGFVATKGKYVSQLKEGRWQFFSAITSGCLISEEEYSKNLRNGLSVKYYPDSIVAEKLTYVNDIRNGEWISYYPDGSLSFKTNNVNGKIDGSFEAYYENGKLELSGHYKGDLREGLWHIYKKNGSLRFEIEYVAGIPKNLDLEIYQSDYIDSLEQNRIKIADPEKTGEIW